MTHLSKRAEEVFWGDASTMDDVCAADVIERITEALRSVRREALEEAEKAIKQIDPLEAIADWEDSESIAFAVNDYGAKAIRELIDKESLNQSTKEGRDA